MAILDAMWSTAIHCRDKGIDQYSWLALYKEKPGFDAHHIRGRTRFNTRWDTQNGILVMGRHHHNIPHMDPETFKMFLIEKWFKSQKTYDDLYARSMLKFNWDLSLTEIALWQELKEYIIKPYNWGNMSYTAKLDYLRRKRKEV